MAEIKEYPSVITPEMLLNYAHISDDEVGIDIADTEHEIANLELLHKIEQEEAAVHPSPMQRRMAQFRADGRPHQIAERRAFVAFLDRILAARRAANG